MIQQPIENILADAAVVVRRRLVHTIINDLPTAMALYLSDDGYRPGIAMPLGNWLIDENGDIAPMPGNDAPVDAEAEERVMVAQYGDLLTRALDSAGLGQRAFRQIAADCRDGVITDVGTLTHAIERRHVAIVHKAVTILLIAALAILYVIYRYIR